MMAYKRKDPQKKEVNVVIAETAGEMGRSLGLFVRNNIKMFIYILQFCGFVGIHILGMEYNDIVGTASLYVVLMVLIEFLNRFNANMKNETEDGIPVPPERYTEMNERGYVTVTKEEESILYLCSVEDYLERKGLLDHDSTV